MRREPISVTLTPANLAWLRARAASGERKSVSRTLDALISEVRTNAGEPPKPVRSVVNTISIPSSDDALAEADASVRRLFERGSRRRAGRKSAGGRQSGRQRWAAKRA
jgi:hypothetical protein